MYSLNKASKEQKLVLAHENQEDTLFKHMPALREFKKDKVEDPEKRKNRNAPK